MYLCTHITKNVYKKISFLNICYNKEKFLLVLLCFANIFREICVEKYKDFDKSKDEGASEL